MGENKLQFCFHLLCILKHLCPPVKCIREAEDKLSIVRCSQIPKRPWNSPPVKRMKVRNDRNHSLFLVHPTY